MRNYLIAERYAKGLSLSIRDNADLEGAVEGLRCLSELYETNHDFRSVLANPAVNADKRAGVLTQVLEKMGTVPIFVKRLAEVLLRRGRIAVLPDVATVFSTLADERLNRVSAKLTSAVALDEDQQANIGRALERYSGKTVRIECDVNPDVLGGVVARIGGTIIDGSVRTRLESLRNALLSEEK